MRVVVDINGFPIHHIEVTNTGRTPRTHLATRGSHRYQWTAGDRHGVLDHERLRR